MPKSLQICVQGELESIEKDPMELVKSIRNQERKVSPKVVKEILYGKVCFRTENYISTVKDMHEQYDTILCFSLTKWVHLTFGDSGIKFLFLKAYSQLTPGGFFILEPQLWKSYKKKKNAVALFKENLKKIELRPHLFKEYLCTIGFQMVCSIGPSEEGRKIGQDRHIMVFQK